MQADGVARLDATGEACRIEGAARVDVPHRRTLTNSAAQNCATTMADSGVTTSAVSTTSTAKKGKKGKNRKGKGKKGNGAEESHPCFHCQSEGAKMCCSQCHRAWYCGQPCQKKHWKLHKKSCIAAVAAEARQATRSRVGRKTINTDTCVICIGPVVDSVGLPCGHAYCKGCISELRKHKCHSAQTCPLCRTQLPPGLDGLFDLAFRAYTR